VPHSRWTTATGPKIIQDLASAELDAGNAEPIFAAEKASAAGLAKPAACDGIVSAAGGRTPSSAT